MNNMSNSASQPFWRDGPDSDYPFFVMDRGKFRATPHLMAQITLY